MIRVLVLVLILLPLCVTAQDNTWEQPEEPETVETKTNPDAKYLEADAVPVVDGMVRFHAVIDAPTLSKQEIYQRVGRYMSKMVHEKNQLEGSQLSIADSLEGNLGASFREWLVFKSSALSLDRTQMSYHMLVKCSDGKADVTLTHIKYIYDTERKPIRYTAEEWITDKYAVNKKHTRLLPISSKFRRKTIDRKDYIFNKIKDILSTKQ